MKHLNKLSILSVSVLVTAVIATVNLCCADIEQTNIGLLTFLGYNGSVPFDIAVVCTPLEDSCEFLPTTCQTSLVDNLFGVNCAPYNFTVPPGPLDLCCAEIIPTHYTAAQDLLSKAGYNGGPPFDVATGCIQVAAGSKWFAIIIFRKYTFKLKAHPSLLIDMICQEALLANTVGITCIPAAYPF
ncbi:hypothetical protein C8R45DRAFT_1109030 [Mycena sanguinolenta]|nr:hypothetical protein C8R45DRAFT_1109030 [Mycena sanguinolenta]